MLLRDGLLNSTPSRSDRFNLSIIREKSVFVFKWKVSFNGYGLTLPGNPDSSSD